MEDWDQGPVSLTFVSIASQSLEISLCSRLYSHKVIVINFCTAVVACAKICCGLMTSYWITARQNFHRIWLDCEKSIVDEIDPCPPDFAHCFIICSINWLSRCKAKQHLSCYQSSMRRMHSKLKQPLLMIYTWNRPWILNYPSRWYLNRRWRLPFISRYIVQFSFYIISYPCPRFSLFRLMSQSDSIHGISLKIRWTCHASY